MKDFILEQFSGHQKDIAQKIVDGDKESLKGHDAKIVNDIADQIRDLIDSTRSYGYELETNLDKTLPITTFSEFQAYCERRGLHPSGAEARERLQELIEENEDFDFDN